MVSSISTNKIEDEEGKEDAFGAGKLGLLDRSTIVRCGSRNSTSLLSLSSEKLRACVKSLPTQFYEMCMIP